MGNRDFINRYVSNTERHWPTGQLVTHRKRSVCSRVSQHLDLIKVLLEDDFMDVSLKSR